MATSLKIRCLRCDRTVFVGPDLKRRLMSRLDVRSGGALSSELARVRFRLRCKRCGAKSARLERTPDPVPPLSVAKKQDEPTCTRCGRTLRSGGSLKCDQCQSEEPIRASAAKAGTSRKHERPPKRAESQPRPESKLPRRPPCEDEDPELDRLFQERMRSIPESEEGHPSESWYTREDHKRLERKQYSEMRRRSQGKD